MKSIIDVIDQVYESIYIHRSILVCETEDQVQELIELLEDRDYPCGNYDDANDNDNIRMIVQTYDQLISNEDSLLLEETSVMFTTDMTVLADLCDIVDYWGINLLVTLAK